MSTKNVRFKTFTRRKRDMLEALYNAGASVKDISFQLGFSESGIYQELRRGYYMHRNSDWTETKKYSADKAQMVADINATAKGAPIKLGKDKEFATFVEDMVLKGYSPESILDYIKEHDLKFKTKVCRVTLYSYIDKGIFPKISNKNLIRKGQRYQKMMKVGFIGAGNMGGALAQGISKVSGTNVYIYDKLAEKASALSESIGAVATNFEGAVAESDFLFLGVKPNVLPEVAEAVGKIAKINTVIVSMAAGVEISKIEQALSKKLPIIRIMPNTPVAVGEGLTAYSKNGLVSEENVKVFEKIMEFTGALEPMEECEIDSFCAIAGCGPAYAYMFIDALADGAEKCGVPRDTAIKYASKMIRGSALMALESGIDPKTLCKNVCSPGGATIEGVKVLEAREFEDSVSSAIEAAFKRTKELGK